MNALQNAIVAEAMHPGVITCPRSTSLRAIARMMSAHNVHCIVVFDERDQSDGRPFWGIASALDVAAALSENTFSERSAGEIAASPLVHVSSTETLARAAQLMTEHGSGHLVVVDPATDLPVGVLSALDVARFAADCEAVEVAALTG